MEKAPQREVAGNLTCVFFHFLGIGGLEAVSHEQEDEQNQPITPSPPLG
jgi:hypothetical protein